MSKFRGSLQPEQFDSSSERSLASLIRALRTAEEEPLTCAECREHFAALYHFDEFTADADIPYASVVAHLQECPDCATEYAALQEAMHAFAEDTLPEAARSYQFDLSFMSADSPEPLTESKEQAEPLWTEMLEAETLTAKLWSLVGELQIRVESAKAFFDAFPASLVPATVESGALRADINDSQLELLVLPAADAEVSFQLAIGPVVAGYTVVVVKVIDTSTEQPIANTLVTLRNHQRQLLVGSTTGQDGCVIFEQLQLGRYFIQVRLQQRIWEIPMVIMGGSPLT